jgi:hypothetical protein
MPLNLLTLLLFKTKIAQQSIAAIRAENHTLSIIWLPIFIIGLPAY